MSDLHFRLAQEKDLEAITAILNWAIEQGGLNAFTEPVRVDSRRQWLKKHAPDRWPVFIVERAGQVAGWCSLSPYRPERQSLAGLVEISYYLHPDFQRQGIGSQILVFLEATARSMGYTNLFAVLMDTNLGSTKLLEKMGYQRWAHLPGVAVLSGQVCGQYYYGKHIQ